MKPTTQHTTLTEVASALPADEALAITLVDGMNLPVDFAAATMGKSETKTLKILASARKRLARLHGEAHGDA